MKKLYTFLFSLCVSAVAMAQDFSLTVDGEAVANKTTFTKVYGVDAKDKVPGVPMLGQEYGLYPEMLLTSKISQDVIVTLIDQSHDQGSQFCLGTTCDELYQMNFQSTKVAALKAGKPTNLLFHVAHDAAGTAPYEVQVQVNAYGTVDGESYQSTVVLRFDPDAANVETTTLDVSNSAYYTLSGVKVDIPRRGIYVRGGKKVVVK